MDQKAPQKLDFQATEAVATLILHTMVRIHLHAQHNASGVRRRTICNEMCAGAGVDDTGNANAFVSCEGWGGSTGGAMWCTGRLMLPWECLQKMDRQDSLQGTLMPPSSSSSFLWMLIWFDIVWWYIALVVYVEWPPGSIGVRVRWLPSCLSLAWEVMVLAFGNLHKTLITIVSLHNRLIKGVALMWASKSMRENIIKV